MEAIKRTGELHNLSHNNRKNLCKVAPNDICVHSLIIIDMTIDDKLLKQLFDQAVVNPRLRQNFDLRTSSADTSQRMLNALLPGTAVPIHRHEDTSETVVCLCGMLDEVIYEEVVSYENASSEGMPQGMGAQDVMRKVQFKEVERVRLSPAHGVYGYQVPKGAWHTVEVIEPSVIFEAKDGAYKSPLQD